MEGNASVGTGFVEGDVADKEGCKGTGVEKDQLGVVEDKGNGVRGRGRSLEDGGSSGEEERSGWWWIYD